MEKIAIVSIDYEARADTYLGRAFASQTLASMGARVVTVEFDPNASRAVIEVSDKLYFERTFPSLLSEETWATVATTASEWWAKQTEAFNALVSAGHVHVNNAEEWLDALRNASQDYVAWEASLVSDGYAIIHARDTMSSDAMRHAAFLEHADAMPPPYLPRGTKYGQVGEFDYSLMVRTLARDRPGADILKSVRDSYPVKHTHIAHEDARHAAYEIKDVLAWMVLSLGEFEALVHSSPRVEVQGDAAMQLVEFLKSM